MQGAVAGQPPSPLLKQILDSSSSSRRGWEKLVQGKYPPGTRGATALLACPQHGGGPWCLAAVPSRDSSCPAFSHKVRGSPRASGAMADPSSSRIQQGLPTEHTMPSGKATGHQGHVPLPCPSEPHHLVTPKDPAASAALHPAKKFPMIGVLGGTLGSFRLEPLLEYKKPR